MAAGHSVDPGRWLGMLDELTGQVAGRFGRVESRRRARAFVLGLLAGLRLAAMPSDHPAAAAASG